MPYVYPEAGQLDGKPAVGDQQCVTLVKFYAHTPAPAKDRWAEGVAVKGTVAIKVGTVIATFVNGKYASNSTGNHAAFYISQDDKQLWVVDQYHGSNGIHKRPLHFKGKHKDGTFVDPSNNGDAFSIVE
jgi:hypothetical protein